MIKYLIANNVISMVNIFYNWNISIIFSFFTFEITCILLSFTFEIFKSLSKNKREFSLKFDNEEISLISKLIKDFLNKIWPFNNKLSLFISKVFLYGKNLIS